MVKEKVVQEVREVTLDYRKPLARQYDHDHGDPLEIITEPNIGVPSLYQMVVTGTVSPYVRGTAYSYPDLGDDDEAHEHPDYSKVVDMDPVEQNEIVDRFTFIPEEYEEEENVSAKVETQEGKQPEQKESEPKK